MFPTVHIEGAETSYLRVIVCFGLIIFLSRNLVRRTSVLGSTQHCLCVSYRGARVSKCMQAFSEGVRIIDIISASDSVDLPSCGIISLLMLIPKTIFSSQTQNKMVELA